MLLAIGMLAVTSAKALDLCFVDWWGYTYNVTATKTAPDYWTITGNCDIGAGYYWSVDGYLDRASATMQIGVTNTEPDGCTTYSDGFTIFVHGLGGGFMHATWESYCFGGVLNTGDVQLTWSYGACPMRMDGTFTPAGPGYTNPESKDVISNFVSNGGSILDILDEATLNVANNGDNFTITYNLVDASQNVSVEIYNHVGQLIATLVDQNATEGFYSISWDGKTLQGDAAANGMYFAVLKTNGESISKKFVK